MTNSDIDDIVVWNFTKDYCDYNEVELTDIIKSNISERDCIAIKFRYTSKDGWSRMGIRFMEFEEHRKELSKINRKRNLEILLDE